MTTKLRLWWQQIKQNRIAVGVIGFVLVVVIFLIIAGYWFDWTGFNGYNKVTTVHTINGTNAGIFTKTEEYQPGKTLWDWLNLLGVLAIPVVVGIGAAWYTAQQGRASERGNTDNQRETALQGYIDKMSELLLEKHLRDSAEKDEVRKIARVRTLTILSRLDAQRKGIVLKFLHESGLVEKGKCIVDLHGADLSGVNLLEADLRGADLSGVNLLEADLRGADLHEANLSDVNLRRANLSGVNLRRANLSGVNLLEADLSLADLTEAFITTQQIEKAKSLLDTIWPDGLTHPW
jgi:hypothetical protein